VRIGFRRCEGTGSLNPEDFNPRRRFAGAFAASLRPPLQQAASCLLGRLLRVFCLLGVACLAACVDYQPKPLPLQRSAAQFAERRLDAPELRDQIERVLPGATSTWPPPQWDRAALLAVAIAANPKLAIARAQIEAMRTHAAGVAQPANPQLTLQSEYARHDPHPWLYGFVLDFPLRSPGIKRADIELAGLGTRNAQWQLLDQIWTTRRVLIAALSDWQAARERQRILERLDQAQMKLITIEQKRVAAGEDAPGELLLARQARIGVSQQQADARVADATAQAAVAAAIGVLPQALDGVELHWPEWGTPPAVDVLRLAQSRETALLSRADLAAAIGDYAESEAKLHQAVLRQYPQFQLSPGYYWDHGVAKFPFDVGFTLPGLNRGEIAEAQAARDVSGARMLALQAQINGDVDAALRIETSGRDSVLAAAQSLQSAQAQAQQAQTGLRLGALGVEEELGAQVLVVRSELEVVQLRAQWQSARNALEDALHAPLTGPELHLARDFGVAIAESQR
jgi:outer membrane protein, heavy metal efflux system